MENNEFIKTAKELISNYEAFIEKSQNHNILDFNNNQLMSLRSELQKRKLAYEGFVDKIGNKIEQHKINSSQDMVIFSLCCYGIDLIDDLIEKINNLIKINNEIPNILI